MKLWHAGAVLATARTLCDEGLRAHPDRCDLLHLRGLLAWRDGQIDAALASLTRAATLAPTNVTVLCDLGDVYALRALHGESEQAYRRALALAPDDTHVHRCLGRALANQGQFDEASAFFERAIHGNPRDARTYADWGDAWRTRSQRARAIECYERAISIDSENAEWHGRLGRTYLEGKAWQLALRAFRDGIRADNQRTDLHTGAGTALLGLGMFEEAIESFQAALVIDPKNIEALQRLLGVFELLGRRIEAAGVWFALGRTFEQQGELDGAKNAYRETLARKPDHLKAHVSLGEIHVRLGQPAPAIECFEAARAIKPGYARTHQGLSRAFALAGDLPRHWEETAWFNRNGPWKRRYFEQPAWNGERMTGRTVLVWTNESVDDTILLVRFAHYLKAKGARVVVECHPTLVPLVTRMDCVEQATPELMALPLFDAHVLLPELPRILQTSGDTLPARLPYLEADSRLADEWRVRAGPRDRKIVGLALGHELASTVATPGIRFIGLDSDPRSLDETAAVLANLDLVITADLTIAHLAGAMHRPVWTLLPFPPPDRRWQIEGDTSPWYPTMRLFRQLRQGDWTDVLDRVRAELEDLTR